MTKPTPVTETPKLPMGCQGCGAKKDNLEEHRSFGSFGEALSVISYILAALCLFGCLWSAGTASTYNLNVPWTLAGAAISLIFTGCFFGMRTGSIFCSDCLARIS